MLPLSVLQRIHIMQEWVVSTGLAVVVFALWLLVARLFRQGRCQKNDQTSSEHKGTVSFLHRWFSWKS